MFLWFVDELMIVLGSLEIQFLLFIHRICDFSFFFRSWSLINSCTVQFIRVKTKIINGGCWLSERARLSVPRSISRARSNSTLLHIFCFVSTDRESFDSDARCVRVTFAGQKNQISTRDRFISRCPQCVNPNTPTASTPVIYSFFIFNNNRWKETF